MSRRASREARTVVDHDRKIVSVYYASDMEPRIAAWRPGLGCTQLPIGATPELAAHLPRLPDTVSVPSFDDRQWPLGDVDATLQLSKAKSAAVAAVLDEAFTRSALRVRGVGHHPRDACRARGARRRRPVARVSVPGVSLEARHDAHRRGNRLARRLSHVGPVLEHRS
jgi:hypothetical protein